MAAGYRPVEAIEVVAWGKRVGALAPDPKATLNKSISYLVKPHYYVTICENSILNQHCPKQGVYVFQYTPAWIATGVQLAPLFMPLRPSPFSFPGLPASTYRGLPAMIADGLPDSFGNALIDSFLADKGVSKDSITALDRLAYLGKRALGALEFKPARGPRGQAVTALDMSALVLAAREAVSGRFDGDRETSAAIKNLIQVGTSAGGQRVANIRTSGIGAWRTFCALLGLRPSAKYETT